MELTQLTYETLKKKGNIAAFVSDAFDKIADAVGAALFLGYGENEKFLQSIVVYSIKAGSSVAGVVKDCQELSSPMEIAQFPWDCLIPDSLLRLQRHCFQL